MLGKQQWLKKVGILAVVSSFGLSLASCQTGSGLNTQIDGVTGPFVSFTNGMFTMSTVLQNVSFDGGIRVPIPNMPNSAIEVGPDFQSAGTLINLWISTTDLAAISANLDLLDPNALPGGRPLPGVVGGTLPSIAIQVPSFMDATFYVGPNLFGIFIPVKLGIQGVIGSFRYYDATNAPIGTLSVVGEDANNKNSGFLLLINIAGKVADLMK